MKLNEVGALLLRFSAAGLVVRGVTGLVNVASGYARLHHAVESNPALKQGLHDSVKNGVVSSLIAIACGVVCWSFSKPIGRLLANGLEDPAAPAASAVPAND
jgi:hypothetical protein